MNNPVIAYYNQIAKEYDSSRFGNSYGQFIHYQEDKYLKNVIQTYSPKQIASIGCGTGRFMELANIGVDYSSEMLAIAKEKFPEKEWICADAAQIPLPSQSIDLSFSLHVFMHLSSEKMETILQEVARLTAENGIFILDIPSAYRRKMLGDKQKNWHGASAYTAESIKEIIGTQWEIVGHQGILFLPIHRFPVFLRHFFKPIDHFLSRSFFKNYSSYLIFTLKKK
jgi:ubiquinone/menaquinone biosynthesis C-methylase UbiE